jgi:hypothetical protein
LGIVDAACYGPNVTDAATLLASTDVIGIERAADLMGALLKASVSTGFVHIMDSNLRLASNVLNCVRRYAVPDTGSIPRGQLIASSGFKGEIA